MLVNSKENPLELILGVSMKTFSWALITRFVSNMGDEKEKNIKIVFE